jgi:hypothetical protein
MSATQLRVEQIKTGTGITADGSHNLIVDLDAAGAITLNSNSLKVNCGAATGLQITTNALGIKLDGTTLALSASGIKISDGGVGSTQLGILTTKGDLIGFSTVHARLAVGTDGQFLTADSTAGTGLKWATFTGVATTNFVFNETPSGTVNGVNTTFTLANVPTAGTVQVHLNGLLQVSGAGNDYTIASDVITYLTAPKTGDVIKCHYMK